MPQTFSVDQLKLNTYMVTGSTEGLFFDTKQLAFGTDAVPTDRNVIAGNGLGGGGTLASDITLTLNVDDSTVYIDSDTLKVKAGGVENTHLAGSIANAKLLNSSFSVSPDGGLTGLSSVSLGGSLQLGVNVDGSSIEIDTDQISVKDLGITNSHIANSTIQNAKLANPSFTVSPDGGLTGASSVALGGSLNLGVNVDDTTIELNSDAIRVKAGSIEDSHLAGSISNSKLSNNSLTVTAGDGLKNGGSVNLGGSVTLNIEPSDFAGAGLEDDGSDNLRVNNSVLRTTGGQTITKPTSEGVALAIEGTLSVKDLSVTGTLTKISTKDLVVTDNVITLNTGDPGLVNGTGISLGTAGLEIWRGTGDWGHAAGQQIAGYNGNPKPDRAYLLYNDNPGKDYWEAGLETDMAKILLDKSSHTGWLADTEDISTLTTNLVTTGQTLWDRDAVISGDLNDKIGSNVGQVSTNTTNIATNVTNIALKADKTTKVIAGSGLIHGYPNTNQTLASDITIDIKGGQGLTVENDLIKIANGDVTNAMLANDSVSYGGVSLDLGGSDATPAFDLSDATAYKTTNLVGTITNSQLDNDGLVVNAGSGLLVDAGAQSADISLGGSATFNIRTDNDTLEVNSDILRVKGNIDNAHLTNSTLTVTAGDGLQNGGVVGLGGTTTLDVDSTVVRTDGDQLIDGRKTFFETGYFQKALHVGGDLVVSGTTTVVHSNEVDIADRIIKLQADLGAGVTNTSPAGIEVNRGSEPLVQLLWNGATYWTASNAAGTAYEILTKEKIVRNTVSLGAVASAKIDFRETPVSHTFAGVPSVNLTMEGVDSSADVVSAQLNHVYTTGFVVNFSTTLTGNYKLHYVATNA